MKDYDFLELKNTKLRRDFLSKKFVHFRYNSYSSLDMRDSSNSPYSYLEKIGLVTGYELTKSIKGRARERSRNMMFMSMSAKNRLQPVIPSMARGYMDGRSWNIAYIGIRGTDLFGIDGRKINYLNHDLINVAIVVAHNFEVIFRFLDLRMYQLQIHTVIALTCRDSVVECAVKMFEHGYDDETIHRVCDPIGEHRAIIEYVLKLAKAVLGDSRGRVHGRNSANTTEDYDRFMVRKLRDAGFMGREYFVTREGPLYFNEAIYYMESLLKNVISKKRGKEL